MLAKTRHPICFSLWLPRAAPGLLSRFKAACRYDQIVATKLPKTVRRTLGTFPNYRDRDAFGRMGCSILAPRRIVSCANGTTASIFTTALA